MKIAVISDIHGNLEAFLEVLADIRQARADSVVCLGDNVGYGPDPEGVTNLVRTHEIPCVMGNHELGIVLPDFLDWFNSYARQSLLLTMELLSESSISYIHTLPASLVHNRGLFVHGCPPDSITEYLVELSTAEFKSIFDRVGQRVCFVGHTHLLQLVSNDDGVIRHQTLCEGVVQLHENCKYIINVGAVGQPRDGDSNAKYVIWDSSENILAVRYVPYDIATTVNKILKLGFPKINADRLW
jgi:predicted phosphodiesterase